MEHILEEAIVAAIRIESRSLGFYRAVTAKVNNLSTRRIFELMAEEESERLENLCGLYEGGKEKLADILNKINVCDNPYYRSLLNSITRNTTESEALRIALAEENACIRSYSAFVDTIREPCAHDVFVRTLEKTRRHCEIISEEYMRIMRMVDRTDQDIFVRE